MESKRREENRGGGRKWEKKKINGAWQNPAKGRAYTKAQALNCSIGLLVLSRDSSVCRCLCC